MIKIMDIKETKEWLKDNLYEYDLYLHPIDAALKLGRIKQVPNREDYFYPDEFQHESGCTIRVNNVRELTDEEMKENGLHCRYRYESEVIDAPSGYGGCTLFRAGFNI